MKSNFTEHEVQGELKQVPLALIQVNPYQPRREFDTEELKDLAHSIQSVGLIHPPLVRSLPHSDTYELISGERRFRASQLAGLETIPVFVRHANYSLSAQAALIENIQRVDLNPLEIARALKRLMIEFELTQDQLADQIGKKRSTVANYLRLLTLPSCIQDSIFKGEITMGHAKAILSLDKEDKQMLLYEIIVRDGLNVRETEKRAQKVAERAKKGKLRHVPRDFVLDQLVERIQSKLGTKVTIQARGKKGKITINYYNLDDLDRLLLLFGLEQEL